MLSSWRTIWHFSTVGLGYGIALGAIGGTFVYPVFGSIVGTGIGAATGSVMGLLLGIGAHLYNRHAYRQQMEFEEYQSNLTVAAGLITTVLTAIPLMIIFAPVAGLTAAYVSHRYAEKNALHIVKRKNEALLPDTHNHMERPGVINQFVTATTRKAKWVIIASMVLAAIAAFGTVATNPYSSNPFLNLGLLPIMWGLAAGIVGVLYATLIGVANGILIQMLNRVVFSPDLTAAEYKKRVTIIAGVFTLLITPLITFVIGAPIAAIISALAAREYADWYYGGDYKKKKRDTSRLLDAYDSDESDPDWADESLEESGFQHLSEES